MAQIIPLVSIMLDKERHLRLDANGMIAFAEETGKDFLKGIDLGGLGSKDMRALVWACLIHEDEALTLKDVGRMLDLSNMAAVFQSATQAVRGAMPEAKPEGEASPNPPAA